MTGADRYDAMTARGRACGILDAERYLRRVENRKKVCARGALVSFGLGAIVLVVLAIL